MSAIDKLSANIIELTTKEVGEIIDNFEELSVKSKKSFGLYVAKNVLTPLQQKKLLKADPSWAFKNIGQITAPVQEHIIDNMPKYKVALYKYSHKYSEISSKLVGAMARSRKATPAMVGPVLNNIRNVKLRLILANKFPNSVRFSEGKVKFPKEQYEEFVEENPSYKSFVVLTRAETTPVKPLKATNIPVENVLPKTQKPVTADAPPKSSPRKIVKPIEKEETVAPRKPGRPAKPKLVEIEEETATPRKPGRPAKPKLVEIEEEKVAPRKPGRPAKPKVEEKTAAKPGRPAKPKVDDEDSSTDLDDDLGIDIDFLRSIINGKKDNKPAAKPGRPTKPKSEEEKPAPRKPGRPAKPAEEEKPKPRKPEPKPEPLTEKEPDVEKKPAAKATAESMRYSDLADVLKFDFHSFDKKIFLDNAKAVMSGESVSDVEEMLTKVASDEVAEEMFNIGVPLIYGILTTVEGVEDLLSDEELEKLEDAKQKIQDFDSSETNDSGEDDDSGNDDSSGEDDDSGNESDDLGDESGDEPEEESDDSGNEDSSGDTEESSSESGAYEQVAEQLVEKFAGDGFDEDKIEMFRNNVEECFNLEDNPFNDYLEQEYLADYSEFIQELKGVASGFYLLLATIEDIDYSSLPSENQETINVVLEMISGGESESSDDVLYPVVISAEQERAYTNAVRQVIGKLLSNPEFLMRCGKSVSWSDLSNEVYEEMMALSNDKAVAAAFLKLPENKRDSIFRIVVPADVIVLAK